MSALAVSTGSVNLGQGFPDSDGPPALLQAAQQAIADGHNQYPPGLGIPELRGAIAQHQQRHYGVTLDPDTDVLVTTGATAALTAALLAFVEPGDDVVALEPFFDSYPAAVQLAGGRLRGVVLEPPDFGLDVERLRAAVTDRTRVLVLNSPHNPTGAVLSRDELTAVSAVATERDLLVIADEVYEHLTYDGVEHVPISSLPGMRERTITASSAGKTFSVTGWKIGWLTGPEALVRAVRAVKQYLSYVSGAPFQPAVAQALTTQDAWVADLRASLQHRRDLLVGGLRELGLETYTPAGTYFAISDVRSWGYADAARLARELPARAGVVTIPCSAFYDRHRPAEDTTGRSLVRWTFSKAEPTLTQALRRLAAASSEVRAAASG
jgi:N-succinyldiaminopimelate aminotransferase